VNDLRMKIAAFALVLGLGGLGGYAMSSNGGTTQQAAGDPTPTTQVIRRTVHAKPAHQARPAGPAGATPAATPASNLTSRPVSTGSSGSAAPAPSHSPVSTGSSGSGGGGGGGGEGEHEGGGDD
jgi:hypothetical protein